MEALKITSLFDLSHTLAGAYLAGFVYPWQALGGIKACILSIGPTLDPAEYEQRAQNVWVAKSAVVYPSAYLGAPCIIGPRTEIRHCAFIRGSALIGADCVIGNSVEVKNAIIFDRAQVPHFNYVGDSILGCHAHMGAGSITSNVKSDNLPVSVKGNFPSIETGLRKFGAMLGDNAEIGCNTVLNPGTIIGRNTIVYPSSCIRGCIEADSIYKGPLNIVKKEQR